jgi:hypothetical protein
MDAMSNIPWGRCDIPGLMRLSGDSYASAAIAGVATESGPEPVVETTTFRLGHVPNVWTQG